MNRSSSNMTGILIKKYDPDARNTQKKDHVKVPKEENHLQDKERGPLKKPCQHLDLRLLSSQLMSKYISAV